LKNHLAQSLLHILDQQQVITNPIELITYEMDSSLERGTPDAVVFPRSTGEVSRVMQWASANHVPIVARGAGTGRSGGAVPALRGIVLEFSKMNRLIDLDATGRSVVVEPGLVNLTLDTLVKVEGMYYPPDPSSGRVATMGGNVAENAGGPHCFKYGVTTKYITGLEIVLADGKIMRLGGRALDYPEYDLTGVVTGNEGTLGAITRIDARLVRMPPSIKTMTAAFDSIAQAGQAVSAVIAAGLIPATLEMMDQQIMRHIEEFAHPELPVDAGAMLIIEVDGYPASLDPQISEIADLLRQNGARDLKIARTEQERETLWFGRKSAGGAYPHYTVDSTVPRSRIAETLDTANRICEKHGVRVGHVFHAGDGNLHPSIMMEESKSQQVEAVLRAAHEIMQEIVRHDGAITGEHGVGIEKREFMPLMYTPNELAALWDVKQVFDPNNLMNPGKIFPSEMPRPNPVPPAPSAPGNLFAPSTAEQAAAGLRKLSELGRRVMINGQSNGAVTLTTRALSGIKTYAPDDLYVTAGAGTPLDEMQAFLAKDKRQIPLVSPWRDATIGGLIAANVNAPQRMLYGSVRDQLLCATVALADGRVIRAGRPVVKNVAGYDLPKLFVGSYGTLGLLVDVTLKLMPLPRAKRTLLIPVDDLHRGLNWAGQLLSLALVASALVLQKGSRPNLPMSPFLLAYTAEGISQEVESELTQVCATLEKIGAAQPIQVDAPSGTELWQALIARAQPTALQVRVGIAPKNVAEFVSERATLLDAGLFLVDVANGIITIATEQGDPDHAKRWLEKLRRAALDLGGYAIVTAMPEEWNGIVDRWGYRPESRDLMRALKRRWDPAGILEPGTFVV
jgi:D-lactate dehydrogenase (cytochrome)